ncbi:MAG: hypothetical protein PUA56_06080 [Bacillales bacterium]|nr:hypothetical protein [Bacillales bacterium]
MAKLTRKSYKRKKMIAGVALFMSVALISTGFASFVISGQGKKDANGNVTVGTISDAGLEISFNGEVDTNNVATISFEPKEGDNKGRVRASATGPYENLEFTLSGTVANHTNLGTLTVKMSQVLTGEETSGIKAAADANYITLPECWDTSKKVTVNDTGAFSVKFTFGWGTKFGGENPCVYYDEVAEGQAVSDEDMKAELLNFRKMVYGTEEENANSPILTAPKFLIEFVATAN